MSRGFGVGLVVLLLTAAWAMPAAADAANTPQWYSNLAKIEEGRQVPFVAWGQLRLGNSKGAPIECSNNVTGYLENPPGGGPGIEVTQAWTAYDCTDAECESSGGHLGLLFENESSPGADVSLNWPGELTEAVAGAIRLKSTNVRVYSTCQFDAAAPTERAGTGSFEGLEERETKEYSAPGAVSCTTASPGVLEPNIRNGTNAEKPSKIEFVTAEGLECGPGGKGYFGGRLKMLGYPEAETITTTKPREAVTQLGVRGAEFHLLTFKTRGEVKQFSLVDFGPQAVEVQQETITHATGGEFAIKSGCVGKTILIGKECSISIEFRGPNEESSTSTWTATARVEDGERKGEKLTETVMLQR